MFNWHDDSLCVWKILSCTVVYDWSWNVLHIKSSFLCSASSCSVGSRAARCALRSTHTCRPSCPAAEIRSSSAWRSFSTRTPWVANVDDRVVAGVVGGGSWQTPPVCDLCLSGAAAASRRGSGSQTEGRHWESNAWADCMLSWELPRL